MQRKFSKVGGGEQFICHILVEYVSNYDLKTLKTRVTSGMWLLAQCAF